MDKTIRKMIPAELESIYQRIELDFAVGEYAPLNVLAKQIEKGVQQGSIFHNGENDVAYSICADGCANGYVLISLLSVYNDFRALGLGSTFLEALIRNYSLKQGVVVEVEKPENSRTDEERLLCEKRIKFYQKAGFNLVPNIDYSIWDVPMHLMVLPLNASMNTMNKMIGQIIREIYIGLMGKRYIHKLEFSYVLPQDIKRDDQDQKGSTL
ncbi:GNAT family N-acetyltransferase [Desulfosporosinus sp. Sb-LF]|uniref:GNAT family N-acetyltransferase n=1 Tax=Desulfosporosinus sp. Sb-LF TaxID=2560027 RepID=UPI00107F9EFD|nr:GNAT family N-acetyltransferase [Desulfosporosinus sp. Sb-LF]TGE32156.1 N-acetyltransferase [Desulfosporosinus sp. Sb-LF]